MKKILHLISTNVFSGAENVACQIINAFSDSENYEMFYVSTLGENKKPLEDRNINHIILSKFDYKNIKKIVDEVNPDIIHAHDIKASFIASFFYRKCKIISHVHNNHENMRKINIKTILYNSVCKRFKKIIWVSDSAYGNYIFKNKVYNKSIILYNVIDSNEIIKKANLDENNYEFDLIYLGRLTYQKNPERLLNIVKLIKSMGIKDIKLAIVGDGEYRDFMEKSIKENALEKNVIIMGFKSNPYKILMDSKLLILTSRFEGTPMVALEAIALEKPIISTPTDGLRYVIKDGYTGFLLESDEDFANKIINLLSNKELYFEIRGNLKKHNEIVNNLEKYKSIIENIYGDDINE